jgi:hypothetical protein
VLPGRKIELQGNNVPGESDFPSERQQQGQTPLGCSKKQTAAALLF